MIISFITITQTVSFDNVPNSTPQPQFEDNCLTDATTDKLINPIFLQPCLLVQSQPCPTSPSLLIILALCKLRLVIKVIRIPNTTHLPQARIGRWTGWLACFSSFLSPSLLYPTLS
ncbi:hypothetical protein CPC08DRAFT_223605 [Agrocybe pediades]|nr:hypothetical protein CPC08DRAFT_223605 [Agrocybe pediades]